MGVAPDVREALGAPEMQTAIDAFVKSVNEEEQPEGQDRADETEAPPESSEGEGPSEPDLSTGGEQSSEAQSAPEGQPGTEDAPSSYMGHDLSDLPPEKRLELIKSFKEQDRFINRILQQNADLQKQLEGEPQQQSQPEPEKAPEEPSELTDEQLMALLGYAKDDPMFEVKAEVALPLARQLVETRQLVESLAEEREVEKAATYWNETLDALESEFGELPVERDDLLDYAIENRIFDPVAAYHSMMGPLSKRFADAATVARREALETLKKQQAGAVRPRTSGATTKTELKAKDVKSAVAEAAGLVAEEAGVSWEDAIRSFMAGSEE